MTFKVVTSVLNFYIPTLCMIVLNVRIFLAIKRRSRDIDRLGAYATSAPAPAPTATTAAASNYNSISNLNNGTLETSSNAVNRRKTRKNLFNVVHFGLRKARDLQL